MGRSSWISVVVVGVLAGTVSACGDESAPATAVVRCEGDADCPTGQVCGEAKVCVVAQADADAGRDATNPDVNGVDSGPQGSDTAVDQGDLPEVGPILAVSDTTLNYPGPQLGESVSRDLDLTNVGDADLVIDTLELAEDDMHAEYELVDPPTLPLTLAPNETARLTIALVPVDQEFDRGYLLIGSNDVERSALLILLLSQPKGAGTLEVCVTDGGSPPSECAEPSHFDFGRLSYGASGELVARLSNSNTGTTALRIATVRVPEPPVVPSELFVTELFTRVDDPDSPGSLIEQPAELPFVLAPRRGGPFLYVRLTFLAAIDRPLPNMVMAVDTDSTSEPSVTIPITWEIIGCPEGWTDLDPEEPGCEYACPVWPPREEICNTLDDDCDNEIDNGIDMEADPDNCGFCGHICDLPHAESTCSEALCTIVACDSSDTEGWADIAGGPADGCEYACPVWPATDEICNQLDDDCDGEADEVFNLDSDPLNCGQCGVDCLAQGLVCSGGHCVLSCPPGTESCDGACIDPDTDPGNCGGCGRVCAFDNAASSCLSGTCVMGQCEAGFENLDGDDATGCDYQCPVWPRVSEVCNELDDDCDGATDETFDLQNDPQNCGECGIGCGFDHATALCTLGACQMGSCEPRYRDFSGGDADGCEYACPVWPPVLEVCDTLDNDCDGSADESFDFLNDSDNCGECNRSCHIDGTDMECVDGGCNMVGCLSGHYDIDGSASNGCEYPCPVDPPDLEICDTLDNDCDGVADEGFDLLTDPLHCGACDTPCAADELCCDGGCRPSDEANCGICDRACNGVACFGGSCIEPGIVVITELLINPGIGSAPLDDGQAEYLELFNTTAYPINLHDWTLEDPPNENHAIADDVWVPAFGYAVLGINGTYATNGGVVVDYQYSTFTLGNGGDVVQLVADGVLVDGISYTSSFDTPGFSQQLDGAVVIPGNYGLLQTLNDDTNKSSGPWCDTSTASVLNSGDHGTPGAANEVCP